MRIHDLTEMAIPVAQGPVVWKKINDLLNDGKYKEAAELYLKSGGNVRGAKRTWNVAQANNKIAGDKVPGPIYGMIDKKHDFDKFKAAMGSEVTAPAKNRARKKDPEDGADLATGYKTMSDLKKTQALNIKDGNAKGADLARRMAKDKQNPDTNPVKTLTKDSERFGTVAKQIERYEALDKKSKSGEKLTGPEKIELIDLRNKTLAYRTKSGVTKQAIEDFKRAETIAELQKVFKKYIDKKTRIDDRDIVVSLLNKIRKVAKGKQAVDLHLQLKQVFRNKNNQKSIDQLIDKYGVEAQAGLKHLAGIDGVLGAYENGSDISRKSLESLQNQITKMLPTMKDDKKYDAEGLKVYTSTSDKLKAFLAKNSEPDVDDLEDILDDMSDYQTKIKKEAKKLSIKEDILYNVK